MLLFSSLIYHNLKGRKKIFYASAGIHNWEWCLVACSTPVSVSQVLSSFQVQDLLRVRKIAHFLTGPRPLLSSCEALICLLGLEVSCSQGLDEGAIPWALSLCPIPGCVREGPWAPWHCTARMQQKERNSHHSKGQLQRPLRRLCSKSTAMSSCKTCRARPQADVDSHRQECL